MSENQAQLLDSVIECLTFSSADAKFKALLSVDLEWAMTEGISSYTAPDRISEIECRIFHIDSSLIPSLFWAYERYIGLIGCVDAYFGEFVNEERSSHPEYFRGDCVWDFWLAVGFMVNVCKLPQPDAMGWVCKIIAAEVRGDLYAPQ